MSNAFDIGSQLKQLAQLQQDGELSRDEYNLAKAIVLDNKHPQQRTLCDELYALLDLYDNDDLSDEEFEQAKASLLGIERNVKLKNASQQRKYVKIKSKVDIEPEKAVKEKSTLYTYIRDLPNEQAKNKKLAADLEYIEDADADELRELEQKYKMQIYKMGFALLFLTPIALYLGLRVLVSAININLTTAYAGALIGLFLMAFAAIPAIAAFGKLIQSEYLLRVVRKRQGNGFSIRWVYQFSGYLGFSVLMCGFCACSSTVWSGFRARDYIAPSPRATQTPLGGGAQQAVVSTLTPRSAQPTDDNWMQATFKPADATAIQRPVQMTMPTNSPSQQSTVIAATTTPAPTNTQPATPTLQATDVVGQTTTNGVNARSCASTTCDVIKVVSSRDSFVITGTYDDWHSVAFEDGKTAYIRGDFVVLPQGAVLPAGPTLTSAPRATDRPIPTSTKRPTSTPRPAATNEKLDLTENEFLDLVKASMSVDDYPIYDISRNGNEIIIVAPETPETDDLAIARYRVEYLAYAIRTLFEGYSYTSVRPPTTVTMRFELMGITYGTLSVSYQDGKDFMEGDITAETFVARIRIH